MSLKRINAAIKAMYPKLDIEFVKGKGYFYFVGNDGFDEVDSIFVCHLSHAPYKWWVENVFYQIDNMLKRRM